MPKKPKIDRSKIVPGPLSVEEYDRVVGKDYTKARIVNPSRERDIPGQWHGDVFVPDPVPETNVVGILLRWRHLGPTDNRKLVLKATEADFRKARSMWNSRLGTFDEVENQVRIYIADNQPKAETSGERYYRLLDAQERAQTYGATDTRSDIHIARRNRIRRALGL